MKKFTYNVKKQQSPANAVRVKGVKDKEAMAVYVTKKTHRDHIETVLETDLIEPRRSDNIPQSNYS